MDVFLYGALIILAIFNYFLYDTLCKVARLADKDIRTIFKNQTLFKKEIEEIKTNPVIAEGKNIFFIHHETEYPITIIGQNGVSEIFNYQLVGIKKAMNNG